MVDERRIPQQSGDEDSTLRLKMDLIGRFFEIPEQSCFLFGPRGTGKSTWLRHQLPDALFVDLLDPARHRSLEARPERLLDLLAGALGRTVVVDEIQRVPELLTVVHAALETLSPPPRFVLTGSSARKLRRGGVDLLGGRAIQCTLHPFMAAELPAFDLAEALQTGLIPLVLGAAQPATTLAGYASLYLDQEVRAEGLTRNVGNFARFLEAASFSHGGQLNVASIARECEVPRKVVAGYIEILNDLLLAFTLPVFRKRAKRQTSVHSKFYLFDAGVFRALRPKGPLDRPSEIDGQALEGLVAQHLRAWSAYSGDHADLYFWRTRSGVEVDFVVYGEHGLQAFEVKNTNRVDPKDMRGLRSFREDYPEAQAALLYRGQDRLRIGGIWCLPVDDFLRRTTPRRGLLDWLPS